MPEIGLRQGQGRVGDHKDQSQCERLRAADEGIEGRSAFRREPLSRLVVGDIFVGIQIFLFFAFDIFSSSILILDRQCKAPT